MTHHPWKLLGPWYDRTDDRDPVPSIQMYKTPDCVEAFLRDPRRSLALRDRAEDAYRLFQPVDERYYLVVAELHCDAPGSPSASYRDVCAAGFVVLPAGADPSGDEETFPMHPVVPDPRDARHPARGRALFFGVIPVRKQWRGGRYALRCFVRRHDPRRPPPPGADGCCEGRVWSAASAPVRFEIFKTRVEEDDGDVERKLDSESPDASTSPASHPVRWEFP